MLPLCGMLQDSADLDGRPSAAARRRDASLVQSFGDHVRVCASGHLVCDHRQQIFISLGSRSLPGVGTGDVP
jgi:hypothetical protein